MRGTLSWGNVSRDTSPATTPLVYTTTVLPKAKRLRASFICIYSPIAHIVEITFATNSWAFRRLPFLFLLLFFCLVSFSLEKNMETVACVSRVSRKWRDEQVPAIQYMSYSVPRSRGNIATHRQDRRIVIVSLSGVTVLHWVAGMDWVRLCRQWRGRHTTTHVPGGVAYALGGFHVNQPTTIVQKEIQRAFCLRRPV